MHSRFRLVIAKSIAIWSFGLRRGDPALGISLSLPYRFRFLSGLAIALFLITGLALPACAAHHRRHLAATAMVTALHGHGHRGLVQMLASPTDPQKDAALIVDGAT